VAGICYILYTTNYSIRYIASGTQGGLKGFWHMVFADGFLFSVNELRLLTNPSHWVKVLDVVGSYMYILL
jgi:hypothetical protein